MKTLHRLSGVVTLLLVVGFAHAANAQSTIFNIPTTDVVSPGKVYGEIDFLLQTPGPDEGDSIKVYNPRLVVGLPGNVEAGVNFPIFDLGDTFAYIEPNVKAKLYSNDDSGFAVAAGALLHTALNDREGQSSWGLFYGGVSKKFKSGTRVHAGPYGIADSDEDFIGPRAGVLLGFEQPIGGPVSFVADWFSGKNYYGYFTPGISIVLPRAGLLNVGYSIGNDEWDDDDDVINNSLFFVYFGITVP